MKAVSLCRSNRFQVCARSPAATDEPRNAQAGREVFCGPGRPSDLGPAQLADRRWLVARLARAGASRAGSAWRRSAGRPGCRALRLWKNSYCTGSSRHDGVFRYGVGCRGQSTATASARTTRLPADGCWEVNRICVDVLGCGNGTGTTSDPGTRGDERPRSHRRLRPARDNAATRATRPVDSRPIAQRREPPRAAPTRRLGERCRWLLWRCSCSTAPPRRRRGGYERATQWNSNGRCCTRSAGSGTGRSAPPRRRERVSVDRNERLGDQRRVVG